MSDAAINVHRVERGAAIHLIRYDYDAHADEVPRLPEVTLDVRLPEPFRSAEAYSPSGAVEVRVDPSAHGYRMQLRNVPLYSIVLLRV